MKGITKKTLYQQLIKRAGGINKISKMKRKFFRLKKYNNPYLSQRAVDPLKKKNRKRILVFFILAAILAGLVYLIIYSPLLKIKKIVISGTEEFDLINDIQIIATRETTGYDLGIWPRNNILLLNKEMFKAVIDSQVVLDELAVQKRFLHTLEIYAKEKVPQLLWKEGEEYFYIDKSGTLMAAVAFEDIKYDLPLINRGTTTQAVLTKKIIEPSNIDFIQQVLAKVSEINSAWQISRLVALTVDNSEIFFYTNEGWYFILKVNNDITKSIYNLKELLAQKIEDRSKLKYVDLRIEDRIYYK